MNDVFTIREATINDVPLILSFIKELATYEKLLHEVRATEAILKKTLFGKKAYAEAVIGYLNDQPVSLALFFHNFSTFLGRPGIYLEDLFVKPHVRHKGIGEKMVLYVAHLAKERECGRLEGCVINWNESAINFYKKHGAIAMDEWTTFRMSEEALQNLATSWIKTEINVE